MSTEPPINDDGGLPAAESERVSVPDGQNKAAPARKARQRSVYLFPAYGFTTALDIARRVEESGGGTLTEETLAVNMGLSVKSSGFRLKSLAARQFQLVSKQGETLTTTPVAKAIFKPTSGEDAQRGYRQSFMSIPLFQAVAERYRGQRLPESQTLRNVLEREFQVEHKRVQQAERLLLDSARDTYLLKHQGDGTYLIISDIPSAFADEAGFPGDAELTPWETAPLTAEVVTRPPSAHPDTWHPPNTIVFNLDEIGQLPADDFEKVWEAVGILVKARSARRRAMPGADGDEFGGGGGITAIEPEPRFQP